MASIENRSKIQISVKNRDDLTKTFEYSADKAIKAYVEQLKAQGYKPKLASLNNYYAVRARQVGYPTLCLYASSEVEALELKQRIESERRRGIVIDYGLARRTTFADLLIRYLHEEAPRHRSFEVESYKINAVLEDAGLPREDMAAILAAHPNPHPKWQGKQMRKPTGARMREPSEASRFVRKSFADVVPDDFMDYIDERRQVVEASTVDREIDIFAAVCNTAIDMWRIPCAKSPMDGVRRPSYFNERDRRLKGDEEARLMDAANAEDRARSIALRLEELMQAEREDANEARTVYKRKKIVKAAREQYRVLPDPAVRNRVQEYIGYTLLPDARFQLAQIWLGSGANGKGTLANIVQALHERKAAASPSKLDGFHAAIVLGASLIYCDEAPPQDWCEQVMKSMIAGESVPIDRKYMPPITTRVSGKWLILANHIPVVKDQSNGFWRRFDIVPFSVEIPASERDPLLADHIIKHELTGVLNWALAGLQRLLARGRFDASPPPAMKAANLVQ